MGLDELRRGKYVEVKRQRRSGQAEAARDGSRRKAVRSVAYEQAKNVQARFLSEGRERIHCRRTLHISKSMEMICESGA